MVHTDEMNNLIQHFCQECRQRMLRAQATLRQCIEQGYTATYLDDLHQEFDSLVGAARAVNLDQIEQFNRAAASLARHLRNQLPAEPDDKTTALLREAIKQGMECGGNPNIRLELDTEQMRTIIEQINVIVD